LLILLVKSGNDLRLGGRVPVRSGPGTAKLLRRPRTVFPSLLPNNRLRSGRNATGKQTIPGSVRQLPSPARTEPERWDRALVWARQKRDSLKFALFTSASESFSRTCAHHG